MGGQRFRLGDVDAGVDGSSEIIGVLNLKSNEEVRLAGSCSSFCRCVNYCPCTCDNVCGCEGHCYSDCSCHADCRCEWDCRCDCKHDDGGMW